MPKFLLSDRTALGSSGDQFCEDRWGLLLASDVSRASWIAQALPQECVPASLVREVGRRPDLVFGAELGGRMGENLGGGCCDSACAVADDEFQSIVGKPALPEVVEEGGPTRAALRSRRAWSRGEFFFRAHRWPGQRGQGSSSHTVPYGHPEGVDEQEAVAAPDGPLSGRP